MTDLQTDVRDFHRKFGHPAPRSPLMADEDLLEFRIKLIEEECRELVEAIRSRNLASICGEGVDLIYVVVGLFVTLGIPFLPFWMEIQRANMSKKQNPKGGKPIKPEGWVGPELNKTLLHIRRNT